MGYMGSYYNIPKAIFYILKGDYRFRLLRLSCQFRDMAKKQGFGFTLSRLLVDNFNS